MTSTSLNPEQAVQRAEYAILTGDPTLMGLVNGVFDDVPEGTQRPYVRIGDRLSIPDNDHGGFGREITETVHVWTEARGNATGQVITNRVVALLDHQVATWNAALVDDDAPHRVVSCRHEFGQTLPDLDPRIRHTVARFRINTTQVEE